MYFIVVCIELHVYVNSEWQNSMLYVVWLAV